MVLKRVLITGKNSYIGTNVEKWLMKEPDKYYVESISVRGDEWKSFDFSTFDVVLHVAGIAHVKETNKNKTLFIKINRDLAYQVAKLSKKMGVSQFIFMSTMAIYGKDEGEINLMTQINPQTYYAKSKYHAEELIRKLEIESFVVTIIRSPIVFGEFAPGNLNKLIEFVSKTRIFLKINNQRSMIFIDNLSQHVLNVICLEYRGYTYPQNLDYINVYVFIKDYFKTKNIKVFYINSIIFNRILKFLFPKLFKKVFGNLFFSKDLENLSCSKGFLKYSEIIESIGKD
jgi:nucleoside-diphosphate-sugar epimerase